MANYHRRIRRTRFKALERANAIQFGRHLRCKCEPVNAVRHKLLDTGHSPWPYQCLQCGLVKERKHDTKSERGGAVTVAVERGQIVRAHTGYSNSTRGWLGWLPITEVIERQRRGETIQVVRS